MERLDKSHEMRMSQSPEALLHCHEEMHRLPSAPEELLFVRRTGNKRKMHVLVADDSYHSSQEGPTTSGLSDCSTEQVSLYYTDSDTDADACENTAGYSKDDTNKHDILQHMFMQSKVVQMKKEPLPHSVFVLRTACVYKMQQILHIAQMCGVTAVQESTVIQGILLLDWIIASEFSYFMRMNIDVLAGVCVILNSDQAQTTEQKKELYRLVAMQTYTSEKLIFQNRLSAQVARIEAQISLRQGRMVFTDFIRQYFAHDVCTMNRLVHFFYVYMTQKRCTWLLNTYETFVEITLKETSDIQTRMQILDDYLRICV